MTDDQEDLVTEFKNQLSQLIADPNSGMQLGIESTIQKLVDELMCCLREHTKLNDLEETLLKLWESICDVDELSLMWMGVWKVQIDFLLTIIKRDPFHSMPLEVKEVALHQFPMELLNYIHANGRSRSEKDLEKYSNGHFRSTLDILLHANLVNSSTVSGKKCYRPTIAGKQLLEIARTHAGQANGFHAQ